ncbi:MAG: hypothetical protein ABI766_03030 [Gemmatimonadales bacterium]
MPTWRPTFGLTLLALSLPAAPLPAQSEASLKQYFEGRTVTVRIAMPGTEDGIDLYPDESPSLDYPRYADRLKDNGTAIRSGETVMITKIKVKSKLIEFQLGGGGYGTMGDETSSGVSVSSAPKTRREKNLEGELKRETDPVKRRAMNEELDDLRKDREREDARNHAAVADAEETRKQTIRQRRLEGGSRFNLRYRSNIPLPALTPDAVKQALAAYISFEPESTTPSPLQPAGVTPPSAPTAPGLPRKGMLLAEVEGLLGTPQKATERMEGRLKVLTRTYSVQAGEISAEFVEGVLIRYTASSR